MENLSGFLRSAHFIIKLVLSLHNSGSLHQDDANSLHGRPDYLRFLMGPHTDKVTSDITGGQGQKS